MSSDFTAGRLDELQTTARSKERSLGIVARTFGLRESCLELIRGDGTRVQVSDKARADLMFLADFHTTFLGYIRWCESSSNLVVVRSLGMRRLATEPTYFRNNLVLGCRVQTPTWLDPT